MWTRNPGTISRVLRPSRILWAIGYHQPVLHYVPEWCMTGGPHVTPKPARFRFESDHKNEGDRKIKQKIRQCLELEARAGAAP